MPTPQVTSPVRLAFGVGLALASATLAAVALMGVVYGWSTLTGFGAALPSMKANAAIGVLFACGGWLALLNRRPAVRIVGYALTALAAVIAGVTLAEHVLRVVMGVDTSLLYQPLTTRGPNAGRMNLAVTVSLLLASGAIALTRAPWAEDLRQFMRILGLAIPIFAISLVLYDPAALEVIDGFQATPLSASIALALLLVALDFDRASTSLRWQIANVGVVVLAPLVALTVHFASAEREGALAHATDRLQATVRLGADRQDAVIAQARQTLSYLARTPAIASSDTGCVKLFEDFLSINPAVKALYTVERDGTIRCSSSPTQFPMQISDREYVRTAFATGRFTVSGFILAKISKMPRIAVALPMPEGPSPEFLIVASIDVAALAGPLDSLGGITGRETLTLVDQAGVVIARRPADSVAVGANLADATFVTQALASPGQSFEAAEVDGQPAVFFAQRVLDGAGTLIVGSPRRAIVQPVDHRLNRRLLLITAILVCSLALGVIGSETLVLQPLRRLTDYAGRLEAGDLSARPDVRAGGEVGALGRALAISAAAIEDRERRLAGAEALFRGLFDHSPDAKAVIGVEPDGAFRIETWNAAAVQASGLMPGEVLGRTPLEVFPGPLGEQIVHDLRRTVELGRVVTVEREPTVNGVATVFEMVQVPLLGADGSIERIFLSARDISERKRVERLKNEFVSTVSHELRTPLTSIAGSLGLLSGGAAGPLGERARHLIAIAHSNSLRLVRLINDILDIEKIEAGRMTFELKSLPVGELVANAASGLKAYGDGFGVEIEIAPGGEDLVVYGDADRLTQVFTNLVSNAIKFSPAGERVTVSIAAEGDAVAIAVRDRGPGIPAAFRARLFTKFAQADSSDNRGKGGTGLGLAIVREIVERHAGAVGCRDAIDGGAEFEVRLPRHVTRDRVSAPAFAETPRAPKILICEDDALIAAILAEQMRDAGFESSTAGTVRAALQTVAAQDFDAALVDLNLPDGDGISLIRQLRATANGRSLILVVISADADRGKLDSRAAGLNVAAWMAKPVDTGRLERLLRQKVGGQPPRPRILHVEDDSDLCNVVSAALAPLGDVAAAPSVAAARRQLERTSFDLAILDVALEDGSGLELLRDFAIAEPRPIPTIIFSARDTDRDVAAQAAVAMTKSRSSLGALVDAVRRILAEQGLASEERPAKRSVG